MLILNKLKKEGSFSAPFFLAAVIILLSAKPGPLTYPGVAAGTLGVIFALTGRITLAAAAGLLSAATSFAAQSLYGICASCTYAAASFTVAGIISAYQVMTSKGSAALVIALALPLLAGMSMYVYQAHQVNNIQQARLNAEPAGQAPGVQAARSGVPRLYFAPWCRFCEEPLKEFVKNDPEGKTWQPVVIPYSGVSEGEKLIRGMGYRGKLMAEAVSPGRGVPCLAMPDGRILVGKTKIIKVALTLEKEANPQ